MFASLYAGLVFINLPIQLGTSVGLAVTSTIANTVSRNYLKHHNDLSETDPAVLLVGFRAAGWVCSAVLVMSAIIGLIGLRGVGLVGQARILPLHVHKGKDSDIELAPIPTDLLAEASSSTRANTSSASVATAVCEDAQDDKTIHDSMKLDIDDKVHDIPGLA